MAERSDNRSDWELVEALRSGQTADFEVIISRYQRQIANIVFLSLGNRLDAEDLTQEVFFRLLHAIPHLAKRDSLFPWLYRTAVNLCIDESRRRSVRKVLSLDFLVDQGSADAWIGDASQSSDSAVLSEERRSRVIRGLAKLPVDQRIVLLMRDFEDLTYQDIAEILGISLASVKTRLFRARNRLSSIVRSREQ